MSRASDFCSFIGGKAGDPLHPWHVHPIVCGHFNMPACHPARTGFGAEPQVSGGAGGMLISPARVWDRVPFKFYLLPKFSNCILKLLETAVVVLRRGPVIQ